MSHHYLTAPALSLAVGLSLLAVAAQAAEGEVKKLDKAQAKVTLKHGEIANLDMPPMTMVFKAKPASLLDGISEGDRVSFEASKIDGQYLVTQLRKLP